MMGRMAPQGSRDNLRRQATRGETTRRRLVFVLPFTLLFLFTACGKLPDLFPPTATPTPTLPPTLTPSLTPTASPTPTPTPIPPARIEAADAALFAGDWGRAIVEYSAVLAQSDDPTLHSAAQLGLAKTRLKSADAPGAITDLTTFLEEHPDSPQTADAYFLLGEAYRAMSEWDKAIAAYRQYQHLRPKVIDSYVEEAIGLAATLAGDYVAAGQAYQAAIAAPRVGEAFDQQERLAEVYVALGEVESALAEYEAIYQQTNQNWRKARAAVAAGQVLYNAGRAEEAYAKFLEAVNNYPEARDSFQGLLILVNDGVPVDDSQRGLTNYYAENYEPAIAAFQRHLDAIPETDGSAATALYHLGLSYAALKEDEQAIATFRRVVENYPGDPLWATAYFQIAFIQPYPADAQTFQAFVADAPTAPEAPDALFRAARLAERHDDFREAAALWLRIADEYPESEQAADGAMQSGLVLYRAGEFGAAGKRFERATTLGSDPGQHARAWLWIGLVKAKLGDQAGAEAAWTTAAASDSHGYYSLRAEELLRGVRPFTPPRAYDFDFDFDAEREQAEAWLRATFPLAQNADQLSELHPGIWQEPRFVRGAELWRLGRLSEAHAEFDSLRVDLSGDPLAMWQLALYFNQIGAHDLAIRSARSVVDLAGYADSLIAPRLILLLRFPVPFLDYVVPAAAEYDLPPFLLLSKMRLESFFWKYAFSSAEARGLNQIIPATADEVARKLGMTDFSYDDLYRPVVSLPMGAYYLAYVGSLTDDDPGAALVGYYAGPGNAQAWQALAHGDLDLFVEVIRLPDAKLYVQTAYEYFEVYRQVYGREN